ncbi:MAG: threonine dehydrogenase-like Zn-dependent dehydrogenase [Gammaproteobacteria bacterium]|jgi:threonine dehydrogenase-like Zn-dependent dehydrogenase
MKALVYTAPNEMQVLEQPEPILGDDLLINIHAVGICGSDMHAYQGHDPRRLPPMVLGHEVCGLVEGGSRDSQQVILNPLITCGYCDYCLTGRSNLCANRTMIGMTRPGGYAERVSVPEQCLVRVPDDMSPIHAALTEPAATGYHGLVLVNRVSVRPVSELKALVIGGGSVGLLTALLLKHQGCETIALAETNALRQKPAVAEQFGKVYSPLEQDTPENCYDLVVDCVGSEKTRQLAMHALAPCGILLHIGLQDNLGGLDARKMTLSEITVLGAYTYTTADLKAAAHKLYSGAFGSLSWVEERSLDQGPETFRALLNGEISAPKVVLVP